MHKVDLIPVEGLSVAWATIAYHKVNDASGVKGTNSLSVHVVRVYT